jgi:hypothetical protein
MTSLTSPASLDDLAQAISVDGIAAHLPAVREVAGAARRAGLSSVAVTVLDDDDAPAIARERAFGLVAVALAIRAAAVAAPQRTATFAVAA